MTTPTPRPSAHADIHAHAVMARATYLRGNAAVPVTPRTGAAVPADGPLTRRLAAAP